MTQSPRSILPILVAFLASGAWVRPAAPSNVSAKGTAGQRLDYVIVEDCGTIVNPMVVEGQTLGGTMQGIGTALYEEMPFDTEGQPLASTMADYLLPGAGERSEEHTSELQSH